MIELILQLLDIVDSDDENIQILRGKNKLPENIAEYKRLKEFKN